MYEWLSYQTHCEKWANVNIKSQVRETSGYDLVPSIVPILSHLSHQDTRPPSLLLLKLLHVLSIMRLIPDISCSCTYIMRYDL